MPVDDTEWEPCQDLLEAVCLSDREDAAVESDSPNEKGQI